MLIQFYIGMGSNETNNQQAPFPAGKVAKHAVGNGGIGYSLMFLKDEKLLKVPHTQE